MEFVLLVYKFDMESVSCKFNAKHKGKRRAYIVPNKAKYMNKLAVLHAKEAFRITNA